MEWFCGRAQTVRGSRPTKVESFFFKLFLNLISFIIKMVLILSVL